MLQTWALFLRKLIIKHLLTHHWKLPGTENDREKKKPLKDESYIFYKYHEESKHHRRESSDTIKEILSPQEFQTWQKKTERPYVGMSKIIKDSK